MGWMELPPKTLNITCFLHKEKNIYTHIIHISDHYNVVIKLAVLTDMDGSIMHVKRPKKGRTNLCEVHTEQDGCCCKDTSKYS